MPSRRFTQYTARDVQDLIADYPLAIMMSQGKSGFTMTPLPMLADCNASGEIVHLIGHMSQANPQVTALRENSQACFLFQGPQGYISPTLLEDRTWVPTWNYGVVMIEADVTFQPSAIDEALSRLVTKMEKGRENAWSIDETGDRYARLAKAVIAFSATVHSVKATFKLGQDERPEMLAQILEGLKGTPLAEWMIRFNATRPERWAGP